MSKYFANFHIQNNECNFSLIKNTYENYLNVKFPIQQQINFENINDFILWHQDVINNIKDIIKKEKLVLNYVFDDELFQNLEQKIIVNKLNCQSISCDSATLSKLFDEKNTTLKQANVIEDFITTSPINYLMQNNEIIKEYKSIPSNRIAQNITQYLSIFKTNLNIAQLNDFKAAFKHDLNNCEINYFLRTQVLANGLKQNPNASLLVDLQPNYIAFSVVKNGAILSYKKIAKGFKSLDIASQGNLSKIKYLINSQKNDTNMSQDEEMLFDANKLASYHNEFKTMLFNSLSQYIALSFKNPLINNLNHIAFTGQFAWMVKDIEQTFFSLYNKNNMSVSILANNNNFKLFELDDKILEQVVIATNNQQIEMVQNNTVTSKIDYTHQKSKHSAFTRFINKFNLFK
ncbi:MAG3720 family protein [Mycoplasma seminis]|uniref:Uncharacterized protein n=1 Tax=Mycoplasma seminis TaxID=512749 RepID=A0ABY9H9B1_9MOLU|nr:hypothetical protein [Mycoplasma seminis]WLP85172.1 hypothetical protein Q8852_02500 [Mycoplasma seminis]